MRADDVAADLAATEGVHDVHDLHLWTLTSGMDVATAHLVTVDGADAHEVLDRARDVLRDQHGVAHATLQVEPRSHTGCHEVGW
jgi:cobalt-zinc-cadmium efflux system protein